MRYSQDTKNQANELIRCYYKMNLQSTPNLFDCVEDICQMIRLAKEHHTIQEHDCNGTKTSRMEKREFTIERQIKEIGIKLNLAPHFSGDPRGYTVKLHHSSGNLWNTWGGRETGYGIG